MRESERASKGRTYSKAGLRKLLPVNNGCRIEADPQLIAPMPIQFRRGDHP